MQPVLGRVRPIFFTFTIFIVLLSAKILSSFLTNRSSRRSPFVRYLSSKALEYPFSSSSMPVEKPLIDERLFHQFQLQNGISVTLVSDTRSEKSSCALSIGFGAAKDTLPGLAHMTEHAVFLGSEKYPEENAYKKFLSKNGGGSNGATGMEYTMYKFYVNSDTFEPALDIFAQFFKKPLLSNDSIKREVNAVDSEDSKNRILDNRRTLQVLKDITDLGVSYSKYSTGNLHTLAFSSVEEYGDILVKSVQDFHRDHYLPSKMKLCLVGPQSLAELERLASSIFADITEPEDASIRMTGTSAGTQVNRETAEDDVVLEPTPKVFELKDNHHSLLKLRPSKDIRDISFLWTLPYDRTKYRTDPTSLISYLLNQREEGTLLATLQDLGFATSVSGSYRTTFIDPISNQSFAIYDIGVSLTELGLHKWQEVHQYVMNAMRLVANLSDAEVTNYWEEIRAITTLSFAFQSQPSAYEQATSAVNNMLDYELEHVLSADALVGEMDLPRFRDYCQRMLSQSQVILLRSRTFKELPENDETDFIRSAMDTFDASVADKESLKLWKRDGSYFHKLREHLHANRAALSTLSPVIQKEPFYGVSYQLEYVPTISADDAIFAPLKLHNPNRFICRRLLQQVLDEPEHFRDRLLSRKLHSLPPTIMMGSKSMINDDSNAENSIDSSSSSSFLWISEDEVFHTPKSVFHLFIPLKIPENTVSISHPRSSLLNTFFEQIVSREFCDAFSAGLGADLSWSRRGLTLKFQGYSEGIFPFAKLVVCSILGVQVDGEKTVNTGEGLWKRKVSPILFENFKERKLRSLRSWTQSRPDSQAQTILNYLLREDHNLPDQIIDKLQATKMEDLFELETEIQQLLTNYLKSIVSTSSSVSKGSGIAHLHGSLPKIAGKQCLEDMFASIVETAQATKEHVSEEVVSVNGDGSPPVVLVDVQDRTRILPAGKHHVVSLPAFNEQDANHAYFLFVQTEERSPRNSALMILLRRLWSEPAFNTLRTQQQLGYIVSFSADGYGRGKYSVRGFEMRVLSKRFNPVEIESSVEKFFVSQIDKAHNGELTEQEVRDVAKSIIKSLRDPPTSYAEEANDFWSSIANDFPFDWNDQVIAQLETLTLADLQAFITQFVADATRRKSVAIHIYGAIPGAEETRNQYVNQSKDMNTKQTFLQSDVEVFSTIDALDTWREQLPWSKKSDFV